MSLVDIALLPLRVADTAWSAVTVTYASDTGCTVTGLVLKWLTGESRNDSSSRFVLGDGDLDIEDVCNRWAAGRFDAGVFKEDSRFSTKVESHTSRSCTPPSASAPPTPPSSCSARLSR
jgi:hypothetical protein